MNKEQILAMEPGRELDALVAEKVMGWTEIDTTKFCWKTEMGQPPGDRMYGPISPYSTDIAAAWEVVEKMKHARNMDFAMRREERVKAWFVDWDREIQAVISDTAPEAICKAALLAVLDKEETG